MTYNVFSGMLNPTQSASVVMRSVENAVNSYRPMNASNDISLQCAVSRTADKIKLKRTIKPYVGLHSSAAECSRFYCMQFVCLSDA